MHINDNFAKFSEALFVADRHAREEVRQRSLMQQKLAQKEKAAKEEHLRVLAQRARDDRAGIPSLPTKAVEKGMGGALGGYGSDSDSDSDSGSDDSRPVGRDAGSDGEDDEEAREREKVRREKRQEREREVRMNNMGNEQRAKMLAKSVQSQPSASPFCETDWCGHLLVPGSKIETSRRRLRSVLPSRRPIRRQ